MRHAWQGVCVAGDMHGRVCKWQAICAWEGACMSGEKATAVDGTHPTGMHSCFGYPFSTNSVRTKLYLNFCLEIFGNFLTIFLSIICTEFPQMIFP